MENIEQKTFENIRRRIEERKQRAIERFGELKDSDSEYWKRRKSGKSGQAKHKAETVIYNDGENRKERRNFKKLWESVLTGKDSIRHYTKSKKKSKRK